MTSKEIDYRPALIIIDMVKDNFEERRNLPITPFARKIISPINFFPNALLIYGGNG